MPRRLVSPTGWRRGRGMGLALCDTNQSPVPRGWIHLLELWCRHCTNVVSSRYWRLKLAKKFPRRIGVYENSKRASLLSLAVDETGDLPAGPRLGVVRVAVLGRTNGCDYFSAAPERFFIGKDLKSCLQKLIFTSSFDEGCYQGDTRTVVVDCLSTGMGWGGRSKDGGCAIFLL